MIHFRDFLIFFLISVARGLNLSVERKNKKESSKLIYYEDNVATLWIETVLHNQLQGILYYTNYGGKVLSRPDTRFLFINFPSLWGPFEKFPQ